MISHLGKYVPGKAMVVIIRVGLVVPFGAGAATSAFATFYETFAMMAAGAILASIGFGITDGPVQQIPLILSLALAVCFFVVAEPRVFPRIARLARVPFPNVGPEALPYFSHRLLGTALLWSALGWILMGLSQIALIRAVSTEGLPFQVWPVVIASVALATVAGFAVAVLPAGLGVREGILMTTLAPSLGPERAVVAALALRLVWVVGEILLGGILAAVRPARPVDASIPLSTDTEVS